MPRSTKKSNLNRIPRPINCFMYFRLDKYREIGLQSPQMNHRDISKVIAKWWREASDEEKAPYYAIAAHAKAEHKKRYPNYKYVPVKKSERKVRSYHRKEDAETIRLKAEARREIIKQWLDEDQVEKEECNSSVESSFYFDYTQNFSCNSSISTGSPQFDVLPFHFDDHLIPIQPLPTQFLPAEYPSNIPLFDPSHMPFYSFVQPCTNICNLLNLDFSFLP